MVLRICIKKPESYLKSLEFQGIFLERCITTLKNQENGLELSWIHPICVATWATSVRCKFVESLSLQLRFFLSIKCQMLTVFSQ